MRNFLKEMRKYFKGDVHEIYCIPKKVDGIWNDYCDLFAFHYDRFPDCNEKLPVQFKEEDVRAFEKDVLTEYARQGGNVSIFFGKTLYDLDLNGYRFQFALKPEYFLSQFHVRKIGKE